MSDHRTDIAAAVRAAVSGRPETDPSAPRGLDTELWHELHLLGFTAVTLAESCGGSGGDLRDAEAVVRASPLMAGPIAEATFLVGPLLSAAGRPLPSDGPVTIAKSEGISVEPLAAGGWRLSGAAEEVPWLRECEHVVLLLRHDGADKLAVIAIADPGVRVVAGQNLAGEPRDRLELNIEVGQEALAELPAGDWFTAFDLLGAAARTVQIAAAADEVLDIATRHVHERVQFGRPLIRLQAVQQLLARLAADVTTIDVAAGAAVLAVGGDGADELMVAAAKAEASALVKPVTGAAHQLLGALGFTLEHRLGAYSTRLWSWREEFGGEMVWQHHLGQRVLDTDDGVWDLVSGARMP